LAVFAAALAHGFLLVLPNLDPRHKWVQTTGCVSIGVLALQIVFAAWGEVNDEMYYRVLTVAAILVGLQTLVVPILLKVSQGNQGKRDRLVLQSVEDGIFEDSSGRRYRVSEVSTKTK